MTSEVYRPESTNLIMCDVEKCQCILCTIISDTSRPSADQLLGISGQGELMLFLD